MLYMIQIAEAKLLMFSPEESDALCICLKIRSGTKYVSAQPSARSQRSKSARTREGGVLHRSNFHSECALGVYMSPPNFIKIGCVVKKCGSKYGSESKLQRGG